MHIVSDEMSQPAERSTDLPDTPTRRVVLVLEAFGRKPEWGVRALAAHLGISKSAIHRILQEMTAEGLLKVSDDGNYSSAAGLIRLAAMVGVTSDLLRISRGHLTALRDTCGETVVLNAYDPLRGQYISVQAVESPQAVRLTWRPTEEEWTPLERGSAGRAILICLPADHQRAVIERVPEQAESPALSRKEFEDELAQTRSRGWSVSTGELRSSVTGVSAPIRNALGEVVGAVGIGWPIRSEKPSIERLGDLSRSTAEAISAGLGWSPGGMPRWDI